ncbi:MAG: tetratricopeptide repeat protein, partial [Chloroflexi bacterium]|nr:tetratricopeptide repeat protein [Chloroflexota bacterium]
GDMANFELLINSAAQRGPDNWTTIYYTSLAKDLGPALEQFDTLIDLRPDDWYPVYIRGVVYYHTAGNYDLARADFEQAIALYPNVNVPYLSATMLALRQGRIPDAQGYVETVVREYPDITTTMRALDALYGESDSMTRYGAYFYSAGTYLALGLYPQVIEDATTVITALDEDPALEVLLLSGAISTNLADLYTLQGLAYCNLDDPANAVTAYTNALAITPDFAVVHLLRAQSFQALGQDEDAAADFELAVDHTLGSDFDAWIAAALAGDWTCETFFEYDVE